MNKEEKIQTGTSRAEKDWKTIQTWEMWKNVTRAEARYATTVKGFSREGIIKLYNDKSEKFANRPVKIIECGFSNIENDAYTKRMIELVSSKL